MVQLVRLTSRNALRVSWWRKMLGLDDLPRREHGGTHKTPEENFQSMRLRRKFYRNDDEGRWYSTEVRQDISTGLILTMTTRVTD